MRRWVSHATWLSCSSRPDLSVGSSRLHPFSPDRSSSWLNTRWTLAAFPLGNNRTYAASRICRNLSHFWYCRWRPIWAHPFLTSNRRRPPIASRSSSAKNSSSNSAFYRRVSLWSLAVAGLRRPCLSALLFSLFSPIPLNSLENSCVSSITRLDKSELIRTSLSLSLGFCLWRAVRRRPVPLW